MRSFLSRLTATAAPSLSALVLLMAAGCPDETPASDARGNYDLTYDDTLTVRLKIGGVVREAEGTEEDTVTFDTDSGPVTIDLGAFCGREDVQCPSETLWSAVSVDQPNIEARIPNTHVLNFINNTERDLPAGVRAEVVSGLVDERDRFGLILGAGHEDNGDNCGLLAVSTAGGRFSHEGERLEEIPVEVADGGDVDGGEAAIDGAPRTRVVWEEGAPVDGIKEGKVKLGFLGACAFGPALLAATLELETGFTGVRTGALDPPPFVPLDPEDVGEGLDGPPLDGGVPADAGAGANDAGPADAG
jgi:hypothetical protein